MTAFATLHRLSLLWVVLFVAAELAAARPAWALETVARQAILVEDSTGTVLLEKNADEPMPPSSMSKIMTAYMVFDRLAEGGLSLDDTFLVSEKAWRKGGSKRNARRRAASRSAPRAARRAVGTAGALGLGWGDYPRWALTLDSVIISVDSLGSKW